MTYACGRSSLIAMTDEHDHEPPVLPALLRAARRAYGDAVRDELLAGGFEDMPRNGPYVLGGAANHGAPIPGLIRDLGVSKQAASQLIDTLVLRGYLERRPDAGDRRKIVIELTERGQAAAAAVQLGVQEVDRELGEAITAEEMRGLQTGLYHLWQIAERRRQVGTEPG